MKISTQVLREMISSWIATDEARKLFPFNQADDSEADKQRLWKLWCDPKNWKRVSKERLGKGAQEEFQNLVYDEPLQTGKRGLDHKHHYEPCFSVDVMGWSDPVLVQRCFEDDGYASRCVRRMFIPHDEFVDNFELDVITTPDDDAVVGWSLGED